MPFCQLLQLLISVFFFIARFVLKALEVSFSFLGLCELASVVRPPQPAFSSFNLPIVVNTLDTFCGRTLQLPLIFSFPALAASVRLLIVLHRSLFHPRAHEFYVQVTQFIFSCFLAQRDLFCSLLSHLVNVLVAIARSVSDVRFPIVRLLIEPPACDVLTHFHGALPLF